MRNIILSALVIITLQAKAQWQSLTKLPLEDSTNYVVHHTNGFFAELNVFLLPATVYKSGDSISQNCIYKTTDYGNTWSLVKNGPHLFNPIIRSNDSTLIAGAKYISTNNGISWDTIESNLNPPPTGGLVCFDNVCYAKFGGGGNDYRLFKSTDYCKTWIKINDSIRVSPKGFEAIDANTIVRLHNSGPSTNCKFFISLDGGGSWTCKTGNPLYESVYFDFVTKDIGYLYSYARMYKTINGGSSWDTVNQGPLAHMSRFMFHNENLGFSNSEGMIRKTIDGGKTWIDQDVLPSPISVVNCINDTVCWTIAGTTSKIYYTTNQGGAPILLPPTIGLFENKQSVLSGFSLYPNPTDNGNFQIRWNAEQTGIADVSVFDIYGRLVHQTSLQVTQTGTQDFDVNMNAKTGMYIIRVEQDGKMANKSFLIK